MNATEAVSIVRGSRTLRVGDKNIEVKELSWPDAIALLQSLGEVLPPIMAMREGGTLNVEGVKELVLKTGSLAEIVVEKSAGLDAAARAELGIGAGMAILAECLEVNLSEDVVGNARKLGTVVGRLLSASRQQPAAS